MSADYAIGGKSIDQMVLILPNKDETCITEDKSDIFLTETINFICKKIDTIRSNLWNS
jgi:hypothetical protein